MGRGACASGRAQQAFGLDEVDHLIQAGLGLEVGHHEGARGPHALGVGRHDLEVGAYVWRQVGLVDDEQVAFGDAWAALARDLFPGGHVDDIDGQVGELGAEGGRQVVAARLDEDDVGVGVLGQHAVDGLEVDGGVFADGGVGAATGLHAHDAVRVQRAGHGQQAMVFLGVDVVGDDDEVVVLAHGLAEHLQQGGLAGADGAADAHAQWRELLGAAGDVVQVAHDRNRREYWVSCWLLRMASMGVKAWRCESGSDKAWSMASGRAASPSAWPLDAGRHWATANAKATGQVGAGGRVAQCCRRGSALSDWAPPLRLRSHSTSERPICSVCRRSSAVSRVCTTQSLSSRTRARSVRCQAGTARATMARSLRATARCNWSRSQLATWASVVTMPASMAASSPSE